MASLPGVQRYGVNKVVTAIEPVVKNGLMAVLLFGVPSNLTKVKNEFLVDKNLYKKSPKESTAFKTNMFH